MPDAFELPRVLSVFIKLMRGDRFAGFLGSVVNEFIALARWHTLLVHCWQAGRRSRLKPGLGTVVRALNDLAEPAAGLRRVDAVRIRGRAFDVVDLPAGEVRATHVPIFTFSIRSQNECTL